MSDLETIAKKVEAGERLARDDGLALADSTDLLAVGRLADLVRRRKHDLAAYYIVNTHVNYTNVCVNRCPLCAFACDPRDADAYLLAPDEVVARAAPDVAAGATEIHIVGGLHPDVGLDYCIEMVGRLHEAFPAVSIQALTAVEVEHAARQAGATLPEALARLKEAGLAGLPGGGAEIFDPDVRRRICPRKISGEVWLAVHRQAHRLDLATNATMLYGHVETAAHRVDHLLALRSVQDETGGFAAFIPLAFHPEGTALAQDAARDGRALAGPTAVEDLRTIALARLVLDNFDHVKAFWIMLTPDLAQVALRFGADDLDGTVVREEITHAAGARTPQALSVEDLEHLARAAGCEPVERDTLYRRIARDRSRRAGTDWTRSDA